MWIVYLWMSERMGKCVCYLKDSCIDLIALKWLKICQLMHIYLTHFAMPFATCFCANAVQMLIHFRMYDIHTHTNSSYPRNFEDMHDVNGDRGKAADGIQSNKYGPLNHLMVTHYLWNACESIHIHKRIDTLQSKKMAFNLQINHNACNWI